MPYVTAVVVQLEFAGLELAPGQPADIELVKAVCDALDLCRQAGSADAGELVAVPRDKGERAWLAFQVAEVAHADPEAALGTAIRAAAPRASV